MKRFMKTLIAGLLMCCLAIIVADRFDFSDNSPGIEKSIQTIDYIDDNQFVVPVPVSYIAYAEPKSEIIEAVWQLPEEKGNSPPEVNQYTTYRIRV